MNETTSQPKKKRIALSVFIGAASWLWMLAVALIHRLDHPPGQEQMHGTYRNLLETTGWMSGFLVPLLFVAGIGAGIYDQVEKRAWAAVGFLLCLFAPLLTLQQPRRVEYRPWLVDSRFRTSHRRSYRRRRTKARTRKYGSLLQWRWQQPEQHFHGWIYHP